MELRIEAPGIEKLRARMAQAPAIVREELRAGVEAGTAIALREIRARTPGKGGLRQAIQPAFNADRTEGRIVVFPGRYTAIARYQEAGTGLYGPAGRAYDIFPRFKTVLRFPVRGRSVFARFVRDHPGVKPHWMFRDGGAAARPQVTLVMRARSGRVTRRLGRG